LEARPVGIYHREVQPFSQADRDDARLSIVPAIVDALECRSVEDERGECVVESANRAVHRRNEKAASGTRMLRR
jgi:hypothetical protein